jgi:hypothetical protein
MKKVLLAAEETGPLIGCAGSQYIQKCAGIRIANSGPLAVANDSAVCSSSTPESLDSLTTWGT